MATCPRCGGSVETGAESCADCGARLEGATESFEPIVVEEGGSAPSVSGDTGPVLVVRKGRDVGERFYIDRPRLSIGRDPGSDIFLNDVTVSRNHAALSMAGPEVSIEDAGSLNGTYVNGVCVDKAPLRNGDSVQVGTFQMVFLSGAGE